MAVLREEGGEVGDWKTEEVESDDEGEGLGVGVSPVAEQEDSCMARRPISSAQRCRWRSS